MILTGAMAVNVNGGRYTIAAVVLVGLKKRHVKELMNFIQVLLCLRLDDAVMLAVAVNRHASNIILIPS